MTKTARTLTYEGDMLVHDTHDDVTMSDGSYSWFFDGNTQALAIPHNTAFNFSNSDWTIEFWACPTSIDAIDRTIYSKRASSAAIAGVLILLVSSPGNPPYWQFYVANATGSAWTVASTANVSADAAPGWQHIALVRQGVNILAYKNGVRTILSSSMSTAVIYDDSGPLTIGTTAVPTSGATNNSAYRYRGYLSNFRVTKGSALYTDATINIPTSPLISQGSVTSLLTCQSSTFKDNSSFGHTICDINEPAVSYRNPFTTEKSVKFVNFNQLQVNTPAVTAVTGSWTIEFWFYNISFISSFYDPTGIEGVGYMYNGNTGSNAQRVQIGAGPTGQLYYYHENNLSGTFSVNSGSTLMSLNRWYHIAVVSNGTTLTLYIDGASVGSGSLANSPSPGTSFYVGFLRSSGNSQWCQGYMYNFRYSRSSNIYTGNFVPPTRPLSGSGAQLLLCTSGATFKDYSPTNRSLFPGGFIKPSYMNPFDTTLMEESSKSITNRYTNSVRFDGTNYYLSYVNNISVQPGSGSFTLEAWINPSTTAQGCIAFIGGTTAYWGIRFERSSGGGLQVLLTNDAVSFQVNYTTGSITNNVWTHVALVKNGTSVLLYINGTQSGVTQTISGSLYTSGTLNQIGVCHNVNYFNGYISNLRFTKGIAVYTGNFTVPTSPLELLQSAGTNIAAITDIRSVGLLTCQEFGDFADRSLSDISISTLPTTLNTTTLREPIWTSKLNPFNSRTDSDFSNPVALTNNGFNSTLFNGTSNLLATGAPGLTSENFTIEFWFYLTSNLTFLSPDNQYVGTFFGSGVFNGFYCAISAAAGTGSTPTTLGIGPLGGGSTGPSAYVTGLTIPINAWNHLAFSRNGSSWAIWFNGTKLTLTGLTNAAANYAAGTIAIGYNAESASYRYWFPGYISNLRIVRGYALYDPAGGNITVPTSPLKAINGTYLLACQSPLQIDNSATPFSITATGTSIDRFNPFNRIQNDYSVLFNGSSQYLTVPNNAAFTMGTGDFTIEFWAYLTSTLNSSVYAKRATSAIYGLCVGFNSSNQVTANIPNAAGNGWTQLFASPQSVSLNTWYHVALVRSSGTATLYLNGIAVASGAASNSLYDDGAALAICSTGSVTPVSYFAGYISNMRVLKGTALYTAAFTPPTASLTAIANTSLLTCKNSQILDFSTNRFTITNAGTATVSATIYPPFAVTPLKTSTDFPASKLTAVGTQMTNNYLDDYTIPSEKYSAGFNGTNQYLVSSSTQSTGLTSDIFTVECWFNLASLTYNMPAPNAGTYLAVLYSAAGNGSLNSGSGNLIWFYVAGSLNSPNSINFGPGGAFPTGPTIAASSLTIPLNTWHHVAVSRNGANMAIWFNGVRVTLITNASGSYGAAASAIGVNTGSNNDYNGWVHGQISNFRIVKGRTVYDPAGGNITVPTSPLKAIPGTYLLTCQNAAIVDNSPNAFALTNNNSVPTSYVPTTFYTARFNGSNQYLTAPSNAAFSFGTGDFTVECWLWTASYTNTYGRMIIDARPTGTNGVYWNFGLDTIGRPGLNLTNGGTSYTSSISVADSKWHHVAVTRQSGTIRMFVDGVSVLTPVSGAETTGSSGLRIGFNAFGTVGGFAAETLWNGYLSNLRIVKGTAVYTAAFTPPTRQLKVINNTSLLALQTPTVTKDGSDNNFTITNNGSVTALAPPISWPAAQKQYANGVVEIAGQLDDYSKTGAVSAFFNGTSQYLTVPTSTALDFGTGDFTVEAWIYTGAPPGGGVTFDRAIFGGFFNNPPSFLCFLQNTNNAPCLWDGTLQRTSSIIVPTNTWTHVAWVRSSGTLSIYVNGAVGFTVGSHTINFTFTTARYIGRSDALADRFFSGNISNLRVVKGTAVYTGNFTVPTSPLQITQAASSNIAAITSTSSVSLLTCQDLGLTDESINLFPITNTGGVTTTIKQIPF